MRFIVDLYRYILLLLIAVTIISLVFIGLTLLAGSQDFSGIGPAFVLGGIAFLVLEIMALGITATFISIHDRHAEIASELREIRLSLSPEAKGDDTDD